MTCPHDNQQYEEADGPGKCLDCGAAIPPLVIPLNSPSGSYLQHTGGGTNWVQAHELPRVIKAMLQHTMVLAEPDVNALVYRHWNCKYLNVRVDMRTGHFILVDQNGKRVDGDDEVLKALGLAPLMQSAKKLPLYPDHNNPDERNSPPPAIAG